MKSIDPITNKRIPLIQNHMDYGSHICFYLPHVKPHGS